MGYKPCNSDSALLASHSCTNSSLFNIEKFSIVPNEEVSDTTDDEKDIMLVKKYKI
jgi:hypothetical protein